MGEISFTATGDYSGAKRAVEQHEKDIAKLKAQLAETARVSKQVSGEQQKMAAEAKRMFEGTRTPLEKYNAEMSRAGELLRLGVDKGGISLQTYNRYVGQAKEQYEKAAQAGKGAFGDGILSKLGSMAMGMVSVSSAVQLVTAALTRMRAEAEKAGEAVKNAGLGKAPLAQLPGTMADKAKVQRQIFEMGGADSQKEAGELAFQLISAGVETEVPFFASLKGIDDAARVAKGAGMLRAAVGAEEAGTAQQIYSKAIVAAAPATGVTAADIMEGASQAGAAAKTLGLSDEQLLAATSRVAEVTGSGSVAGTRVKALMESFTRKGIADKMHGKSFDQMIDFVKNKGLSKQGLQEFLGSSEAAAAFGQLQDTGALRQRTRDIEAGQAQDLAGRRIAEAVSDEDVRLEREARISKARRELSAQAMGRAKTTVDTAIDQGVAGIREQGGMPWWSRLFGFPLLQPVLNSEMQLALGENALAGARFIAGDEAVGRFAGVLPRPASATVTRPRAPAIAQGGEGEAPVTRLTGPNVTGQFFDSLGPRRGSEPVVRVDFPRQMTSADPAALKVLERIDKNIEKLTKTETPAPRRPAANVNRHSE
jgi:hypothetical protein